MSHLRWCIITDYVYSSLLPRIANFFMQSVLDVPSLSTLVLLWWRRMMCLQSLIKTLFLVCSKTITPAAAEDVEMTHIQMQIWSTPRSRGTPVACYQIFLTRCWTDFLQIIRVQFDRKMGSSLSKHSEKKGQLEDLFFLFGNFP